ncbi:Histidine--tRNA ligase, mitochondrial [Lachnellula hyalina]|uniref:Histidine--tRNA ligase, mitochondrial n=1 Tax=Lachnellula hyalina TaxID=1316788 RepID=A0A8H8QTF8_9HELO|nr:Histidine--tRNA ligase, mitochondrial [Lachnellula hyalina]TVY22439.1 Histidine--tRNA ligase, mitochondrial [Lachnellula hyalina]
MATKEGKAFKPGVLLKTPKGTRDWVGADLLLRDHIFNTISNIFKRHGGTPLDTPVFELKEILAEKYGEDSRLMYDLQDQGGELCSLRFDLTVPFARWVAMNNVTQVKRYQISKVYRRDQPAIARGRLREFYQCDFDIAGQCDPMIADAEIMCVVVEVFEALQLDITIKFNHRRILDGLFAVAGVPDDKIRAISSAVDKLDKIPWVEAKKEMVEDKGLPEEVADRIGGYVQHSGNISEMLEFLKSDEKLMANENVKAGVADISLLVSYLEAMDVANKVSFDLSLARGLDYYSGLIFEIIMTPPNIKGPTNPNDLGAPSLESKPRNASSQPQVGSIAAGGRYDNLVGMYGKRPIPCVGISFGIDRIYTLLDVRREKKPSALTQEIDVYVMAFGGKDFGGLLPERMSIARLLWNAGIRAEFSAKVIPKLTQQFKAAKDVPLAVILGEDELAAGQVRLKALGSGDDEAKQKDRGLLIYKKDLVEEVKKLLTAIVQA